MKAAAASLDSSACRAAGQRLELAASSIAWPLMLQPFHSMQHSAQQRATRSSGSIAVCRLQRVASSQWGAL
jgi:hypothetical protein